MRIKSVILVALGILLVWINVASARMYLESGWVMKNETQVKQKPEIISSVNYKTNGWLKATVPGTVLTTLVNNGIYPDPYFNINNTVIPESLARNSYWYRLEFSLPVGQPSDGQQIWLNFDGINYKAEVWLNGKRIADLIGMFKRNIINVSSDVILNGKNCLAVKITPPLHPGLPTSKNGGDGTIGRDVTMQSTIGWDWNQPVRDRNAGMWEDVYISTTGPVAIRNPHVITDLPLPATKPAALKISAELVNATDQTQTGELKGAIENLEFVQTVTLAPNETKEIVFSTTSYRQLIINDPRLWWPNGYGRQELYNLKLAFNTALGSISDNSETRFGIREITSDIPSGMERVFYVNGKRVFCQGGNWVVTDMMLRYQSWRVAKKRYYDEIRYAKEANLTMIRVWGGGIAERDEFYDACDEYGILVMQDFWITGDCNGRYGGDRGYPDDHQLFLDCAKDTIKMLRNHPSLAFWCGGNETRAPYDIETALKDDFIPNLDGTRVFVVASDEDGLHGHGPYNFIQNPTPHGFTTELGAYDIPPIESMRKMFKPEELWPKSNKAWVYHNTFKGLDPYHKVVNDYGMANNIEDYCLKAQLVNYNIYRTLFEAWLRKKWDNASGVLLWKYNSVWPSLIWQLYDWYLEPNAGYYSTKIACEPLHIQWSSNDNTVYLVNNTYQTYKNLNCRVSVYNFNLEEIFSRSVKVDAEADSVNRLLTIGMLPKLTNVYFVKLLLTDESGKIISQNFYWESINSSFREMKKLPKVKPIVSATLESIGDYYLVKANLRNNSKNLAFFIRLKIETDGKEEVLPFYAGDNYFSLLPEEEREITIEFHKEDLRKKHPRLVISGWNVMKQEVALQK
ncbi:MAG: glycoside hydrolase family 2 TIM barrel-domain containing protein [bacterium]